MNIKKVIILNYFLISLYVCFNKNSFLNWKKFSLNGTFTINSLYKKKKYFSFEDDKFLLGDIKREFDIMKIDHDGYLLRSRALDKIIGINKNNTENIIFYKRNEVENVDMDSKLFSWNLIELNQSEYLMENQYNKKFILIKDSFYEFKKLDINSITNIKSIDKFKFIFLKLYEEYFDNNEGIVEKENIDVFIKYIDLTDKSLSREGIIQIYKDYDNQEMKYSLRSILKYIPWIRKIFILMPNKKVSFLKPYKEIKEKIIYVNDKEFLGFDSANIFAFSFNLYKMEKYGISKNFIYMEDDYFIGQPLNKSDFFYYDRKQNKVLPYVINTDYWEINQTERLNKYQKLLENKNDIKPHSGTGWDFSIMSTDKYFIEKYKPANLINALFTHSAIAVNIDDLKEIYSEIQDYKYINETLLSKTRNVLTLNQPHFHNLFLLNIKKRKVHKIPNRYINMENLKEENMYIPLFVVNTCGNNVPFESDYKNEKYALEKRFPEPNKYELIVNNKKNICNLNFLYLVFLINVIIFYLLICFCLIHFYIR